jgi:hypothetical protein
MNKYTKTSADKIHITDITIPLTQYETNNILVDSVVSTTITVEDDCIFQLSTFTDWFQGSLNPFNVLRDFTQFNDLSIDQYLSITHNISSYDYLNTLIKKSNLNINQIIKSPISHPVEYSEWAFNNILNAFYLLNWLYLNNNFNFTEETIATDNTIHFMVTTYDVYKKIVLKYIIFQDKTKYDELLTCQFLTQEQLETIILIFNELDKASQTKLKELKFGTIITDNTLISAFVCGSLFLRKSLNGSKIDTYSNYLKTLSYDKIFNNTNNNLLTSSTNDELLFDKNYVYKQKYKKYKNKYLYLKLTHKI